MTNSPSGFGSPRPSAWRRWRRKIAGCLAIAILGVCAVVAAFPFFLSSATGRDWILANLNQRLNPASLEAQSVSFSWFGPARIEGLVLRDGDGRAMIASPQAHWDRSLGQILFDRPNYGSIDLGSATFDIERGSDGRFQVYDALKPLFTGDPRLFLQVRAADGPARIHDAGLGLTLDATHSRFELTLNPAPEPMVWKLALERDGGWLKVDGGYDRWKPHEDSALRLTIAAQSWPATWSRVWAGGHDLNADARLTCDITRERGEFLGTAALEDLKLASFGLKLGPTTAVARAEPGVLTFDPIDAPLNEGRARLTPTLVRDADRGWIARLGPESRLDQVRIDDEVSRQVLAYVAPVLEQASRVRGSVSAQAKAAEWPLQNWDVGEIDVEGSVVFEDVEFHPGGLAQTILGLVGRDSGLRLTLDQPVSLRIADRSIHQTGLAVGLGPIARLEMDGTIGFDRTLDLQARLPLDDTLIGRNRLTAKLAEGASVDIPIKGTFDRPRIDRDAFRAGLKDMGQDMLRRSALRGAMNLLRRPNRDLD